MKSKYRAGGRIVTGTVLMGLVLVAAGAAEAGWIKTNDTAALAGQAWPDLRVVLANAAAGDTIKVSGDFQRATNDAGGGLMISADNILFSGGWNTNFTTRGWAGQARLTNELNSYSVLDVNGSDSTNNRYRVLHITGSGVTVEGFRVTKGYLKGAVELDVVGSGIRVDGMNPVLRHLHVTENTANKSYDGPSALGISGAGARLEYIVVDRNFALGTHPRSCGIYVMSSAKEGPFMLANSIVATNTVPPGSGTSGLGIILNGPGQPAAVQHWTVFGTLVHSHPTTTLAVVQLGAQDKGRANLVNTTVADNGCFVFFSNIPGTAWWRENYSINSILADTVGVQGHATQTSMYFKNTLIDPETPARSGTYFDGAGFRDLGGNVTNQQPQFVDQLNRDYRLQPSSPAYTNAAVLYASGGLGFAFVDVDRNNSYNAGVDVIVHIVSGGGQYAPAALEYYYPTDIQGNRWLTKKRYASNADLVGTMNLGACAPRPPPGGTVITLR